MAENLAEVAFPTDQDVVRPTSDPLSPTGGVVGLWGNLAPQGAIVKVAGMAQLRFSGPARVFDTEEDAFAAVETRGYREGEVLVIPLRGSARRAGHARDAGHHRGALRPGHGWQGGADHRRALLRRDARLLRRPRGAGGGGGRPIALLRDGDLIAIDAEAGTIEVALSEAELEARRASWQPRAQAFGSGALWRYARTVGDAAQGAVTHPGARAESRCYADI